MKKEVKELGDFLGVMTVLSEFEAITNDAISLPKYATQIREPQNPE